MDMRGKVAVVTGGGTGLGREISKLFVDRGANLAIVYSRSREEAEKTARELARDGQKVTTHQIDVSDEAGVATGFDEIVRAHLGVDFLVNNAGTTQHAPFSDLDALTGDVWDKILNTNVKGAFFCARAAAKSMKARGGGAIVNITSTAALRPSGSSLAYSVSKAAMTHLTRGLAVGLGPEVRVNTVAPGGMYTRWWSDRVSLEDWNSRVGNRPLGRYAYLEDIALAAVQLIENPSTTGQILVMDGGQIMP
jgi:3-oxoacyl-[acyl-carrier protein] reductase